MKPIMLFHDEACPELCPFSQPWIGDPCHKTCLQSVSCQDFHPVRTTPFLGERLCAPPCGVREEDRIPGCKICDASAPGWNRCFRCVDGFRMAQKGAVCESKEFVTQVQYGVIVAFLFCFTVYMGQLFFRKSVNLENLWQASKHRYLSKPVRVAEIKSKTDYNATELAFVACKTAWLRCSRQFYPLSILSPLIITPPILYLPFPPQRTPPDHILILTP